MEKYEIIFIILIILAYSIAAFALNMPPYIHIAFAVMILAAILISIIFKYKQKFENERMVQIFNIAEIVIVACFFITVLYEIFTAKRAYDFSIFIILFFIVMFCRWFFEKNKDE